MTTTVADLLALPSDWIREPVQRIEAFLRQLAPLDFEGVPLYVVVEQELPPHWQRVATALGYTSPTLDAALQDHIGDGWRGRGPAMVVRFDVLRHFYLTALHEAGHLLEREALYDELAPNETATTEAQFIAEWAACENVVPTSGPTAMVPFWQHERAYIRVTLHLLYRARQIEATGDAWLFGPYEEQMGLVSNVSMLCAGETYQLSDIERYMGALGDEPKRMADQPFPEIRNTKPPRAFCNLWRRDVWGWLCKAKAGLDRGQMNELLGRLQERWPYIFPD